MAAKESRNPRKAGAAKRSRPEQGTKGPKALTELLNPAADEELEPIDAEGIEDEPTTIEEAVAQRGGGNTKKAKKAAKEAAKAPKLTPEQRRAKQAEEDRATRAAGGVVRTANGKASARGLPCLCGCGNPTVTSEARFLSGHDAQFRSRVLKEEQTLDSP